jgi:hypothetical protein
MLNITVFGNVMPCNLVDINQGFVESLSFHHQVRILNMDGAGFSETLRGYNRVILFLGNINTWT